ncbi:VCBS domain-containing protein [Bosea beijingensis]
MVDDVPTAANDGPHVATEDGSGAANAASTSVVSGNVLSNDAPGADAPASFVAWGGAADAATVAALGQYGTLVQNGDGTWSYTLDNTKAATQALGAGFSQDYVLHYTMQDADGDQSPATLTITVKGANDSASVVIAAAGGADSTVYEHGLTSVGDTSETTTGSFTVSATDGIATIVVGGVTFTLAQMQAFAATNGVVNTGEGELRLTGYNAATGAVSYSYTLSATIDNDSKVPGGSDTVDAAGFSDHVAVLVNGIGGTSASGDLVIRVVDDVPTAANDGPHVATEDGSGAANAASTSVVSGNVLSNDAPGADAPASFVAWGGAADAATVAALGQYGTLVQNGDGTWSYTLDNTKAATQALGAGFSQDYVLHYTMQDADGDQSPATLTITVKGANDSASVVIAAAGGADSTVYEHGLTSVGDTSETTTGSFTVSATDGIATIVVGGVTFTLAQMQAFAATNGVVNTGEGELRLTGYNAATGAVSYSYTLSATIDNDSKVPGGSDTVDAAGFSDHVAVLVNGIGGTSASGDLVIRVVDDVPTAANDGPHVATEDGSGAANAASTSVVSGNVLSNDAPGADAPASFVAWGGAADAATVAALGQYGTLVQNGDGTWSYTLDNTKAATQALGAGFSQDYVLHYTMQDADGDQSPATLTITVKGANDSASVVIAAAGGADSTVYEHGLTSVGDTSETTTGSFTVSATDGIATIVVGGVTFTLAQMQAFAATNGVVNTGEGELRLTGYNAATGAVSYSYTLSATIDNDSKVPGGSDTVDAAGFSDHVAVLVNGIGGTSASGDLVIRVVDDVPTAANDGPHVATEDGSGAANAASTSVVSGNVLSNDAPGADAPASFVAWGGAADAATVAALGQYGTLVQNGDGTWSYTLDNTKAATQALGAGFSQDYVLHYTMQDADGDQSPATLTITVKGANDSASVVIAAAGGADSTVYEHGLTSVGDTSETTTGSFTVSATDGIATIVVGGVTFTLAQMQAFAATNGVVNTGEGELRLTGYNAATGAVSYSYTLSATIDNDSKVPGGSDTVDAAGFSDHVAVLVNGIGGTSASGDLVIRVVDDVPTAANDGPHVATEDGSGAANAASTSVVSGNVLSNDAPGADAPASFVAWGGAADAATVAALGQYGTLVQNGDGTWSYTLDNTKAATQALGAGFSQDYVLHYTMQDADGDQSPATLTITVKGANDSASVVIAAAGGADSTVYEHGLTSVGDTSETTTGSFTVSATDGIATIVVGGVTFTLAQMQAFAATNGVVNTGEGELRLTGYNAATGAVSYSYTLSATIDNDSKVPGGSDTVDAAGFSDHVAVLVNGIGGTSASGDLVIRVVDDVPTAANDGPHVATEDGSGAANAASTSVVSGNVLSNDAPGADAPASFVAWGGAADAATVAALGQYGTLVQNGDGTWSYTLDNTKAATQALGAGFSQDYVLHYTMQDADGDQSPATLTITVKGANDSASVVIAAAGGADSTVYEHGLTSVGDTSETTTGSFTVSATDGIATIVVGGVTFTLAQMQAFAATNGVVNTGEGELRLTGYNAATGAVSYSYTLSATIDNDSKVPGGSDTVDAAGFSDHVAVLVNGIGGTSASGDLVIRVVDDVPTAANDGPHVATEDGSGAANAASTSVVSGNVLSNDAPGADAPASFVAWGGAADAATVAALGQYGTLVQNGDGTWSYTLDNTKAATQALGAGFSQDYVLHYTMQDADGDQSPATLTITVKGANDSASVVIAAAGGADSTVYEHGLTSVGDTSETTTGSFTVSATDGIATIVVGGVTFTLAQMQAFAATNGVVNTGEGELRLTGYNAATGAVSYSYTLSATIDNDSKVPGGSDTVDAAGFSDHVAVLVNGIGGTSASGDLVIRVVDDVPTAANDGPHVATEDGSGAANAASTSVVSGNVLSNDAPGADAPASFVAWGGAADAATVAALGQYGTLVQNGDGTWSYTLDNTKAATQALGAGFSQDYVLHYTMQDADGDQSPATLTITVKGANDSASVVIAAAGGADSTVYEHGLTSVGDTSETTTGSFTVSATDGIATIVVGGVTFTLAQMQAFAATNGVVNTGEGELRLTGYNAATGAVSYSYTLSATIDNDSKVPGGSDTVDAAGFSDHVAVLVNGIGGTSASGDLVIRVVDDVPTAANDGPHVATEDGSGAANAASTSVVSGNVLSNDAPGADAPASFVAWGGAADAATVAALGQYGTLVQNGDGTWSYTLDNTKAATQALGAGFSQDYVLHYTMQDADGDQSPATLTITVKGANDSASVVIAAAGGADSTVYEHGLTSVGDTSETTTGSFTVSATDGIATIVVGGVTFTLAQMQAFAATNGVVNTGEGELRLTGYNAATGAVSYSYTLSATIDNDSKVPGGSDTVDAAGFSDHVAVLVNGIGGTSASGDLVIRVVDDVPTAANDGPHVATEDGSGAANAASTSVVSGNVLSNDAPGADAPASFVAWGGAADAATVAALGQYGTLVQNGDGTWSYTLDNTKAATQALGAGFSQDYVLHYTMQDADGDQSPATLTITVKGANDSASVVIAAAGGADSTVYEHGLTSVGDTSETTTGSFTVSATDGIATIVVGGVTFTLAQMQAFAATNGVVNTGEGELRLTGYNAATGAVSYSYTLSATIDNDSKVPGGSDTVDAAGFSDHVAVLVNGIGGTSASGDLVIRVVDDVPTAANDGPHVATEDGSGAANAASTSVVSGNVLSNDAPGADAPASFVAWGGAADAATVAALGQYGTLVQNGDGTWSYTLDNTKAATQALGAGFSQDYVLHYTMQDADGDQSPATLTITVKGANDSASVVIAAAGGADSTVYEHGLTSVGDTSETTTGSFTVSATDGIATIVVGGVTFTLAQMQAFAATNGVVNTGEGELRLTGYNAATGAVSYSYTLSATIDNDSKVPGGSDTVDAAGFSDHVAVLVNGIGGTSASGDLVIRVVDDVPTAANDGPHVATEDGSGAANAASTSVVSGNVLSNDAPGADAPASFVAWGGAADAATVAALGQYGTLVQNGDGTWSYTLDNTKAATQALGAGFSQDYVLHYTMQDADGDQSPATLTITVKGANDSASVVIAAAGGADSTVYEHGLTSVGDTSETTTGSFTVSATDGIATIVVGGVTFTLAQMQAFAATNGVVNTGEGELRLTGYNAATGAVSYSYTLSATIDNDSKVPGGSDTVDAAGFSDHVAVLVNGIGGTSASGDLVIRVVDDVPTAANDGPHVATEDGSGAANAASTSVVSGNVLSNDAPGADAPASFVAWGGAADAATVAALGQYGTLVQNGDGTWSYTLDNTKAATQALGAGFSQDYVLHYTMQDADGDQSPATLTITVKGANDSASVVIAAAGGADSTVYEHGLTSVGDTSETTTGSFTVSATDGIATIVVGGVTFTLAQMQAFAATNGVVNTGEGELRLTGYNAATGAVSYSYTLSATIDNDSKVPGGSDTVDAAGFSDHVAVLVNGIGGTSASGDLVIRVVDDVPTAANDGPHVATEDGSGAANAASTSVVSGNVLSNDAPGADAPASFVAWGGAADAATVAALGQYGTLVQNGDGTWSYTLDNTKAATQALGAGFSQDYVLHYTMQDADGDQSPATLTITVKGANDSASVVIAAAGGADSTVYEHGLTSVGDTSETTTGSFTVSATDGIATIVVGGVTFTLAQMQAFAATNGVVNTGEGELRLTGYNAATGAVSYSYTLSATIDNDSKVPGGSDTVDAAGFSDHVAVLVNGIGGTSASGDLVIRVVDDVPTAANDGPHVATEDGSGAANAASTSVVSGNVLSNDAPGADAPASFVAWGGAADAATVAALGQYGTLVQNGDGTWSYTLDNTKAATQALGAGFSQDYVLHYTMQDADGDQSPATLTITVKGANDSASVVIAAAGGADSTVYEHGLTSVGDTSETTTGSFTVSATDGIATIVVGGVTFTLAQMQAFAATNGVVNTGEGELRLTGYNAATGAVSYSYTLSATIDNDSKVPGGSDTVDAAGFSDHVAVLVNGIGGTSASGDLVIRVVDDVPLLSGVQNQQVSSDPSGALATGGINVTAGADGLSLTLTNITVNTTGLTSSGHALVTKQVGNVLTAYADNDGSHSYNAGDTPVFTLTVDIATRTYIFDLQAKLDGTMSNVSLATTGSFGAGPSNSIVVTSGTPAQNIVMVTGWQPTGGAFTSAQETAWLAGGVPSLGQTNNVNGSSAGWGLGNNNFDNGEFLRFDFGTLNDYDGAGGYVPPAGLMANASYATFKFDAVTASDKIEFVAHYADGTTGSFTPVIGATTVTINSPTGALIEWIDAYQSSGKTKLNLTDVGSISTTIDHTIPFSLQLGDNDGDTTSVVNFTVRVKDGLSPNATATPTDPIILDLDHNGYGFGSTVAFDMNGDHVKDQVTWNTSHDGMLAYDWNSNGVIDNGTELFAPSFKGQNFASGLDALATLDTNHDGVIDAKDGDFSKLLVWQDSNADGISAPSELGTLGDHGITSINLTATPTNDVVDGQSLTATGTYTLADGSTGSFIEAALDMVAGNSAQNTLVGNPGSDTFVIDPSHLAVSTPDLIQDYKGDEGDVIDLSALLTSLNSGTPMTEVQVQASVQIANGNSLQVDTNGAGAGGFVEVAHFATVPAGSVQILYDHDKAPTAPPVVTVT